MCVRNPFQDIRDRMQAVLCDARYARRQLRRFNDRGRALDALDRVIAALADEVGGIDAEREAAAEAAQIPLGWASTATPPRCCWCDAPATTSVRYAGADHPACEQHGPAAALGELLAGEGKIRLTP